MESAEFWRLTWAEIEALEAADAAQLREQREMAALSASTLINIHRKRGAKPMAPLDFWGESKADEPKPDEIMAILAAANAQRERMRGARG